MNRIFFCFTTMFFILIIGCFGSAHGLPSLIESIPAPPPVLSSPSSVAVPTSNLYQYAEPTYEFNFNYPDNWEPYTETEGSLKAEIDLLEEGYIIATFSVYVEDTDLSLSKYAMVVEEWMIEPQNMPEYKKISEEAVNLGELSAIKRFYTWARINIDNNTQIPIKAIDIYLVQDKRGYILEGQVTQDLFDKILNDLNFMFNSFVVTEKSKTVSTPIIPELPIVIGTAADTTTSSGTTESVFKYCPYCGVSLQPDFKFCPGCGNPIPSVPRSLIEKEDKLTGTRENKNRHVDYLSGLNSTRGFQGESSSEDTISSGDFRGINKNLNAPFKYINPPFISRDAGSKLVRLFPVQPSLPWAVSKRVNPSFHYSALPGSAIKRISPQNILARSVPVKTYDFSFLNQLGKGIVFNPGLATTIRGGVIKQIGSTVKNLGGGIIRKMEISQAPLLKSNWTLRGTKKGIEEDVLMGSSIKTIGSNIGVLEVEQKRSSSLGGGLSVLGQGIASEIGVTREVETLPSLTPTAPQTAPQTVPSLPEIQTPTTGIGSITSPVPEVSAPTGINLTPPGQPVPTPSGPSAITLPVPGSGTIQVPDVIWKQYSLNQAFSHNPMIYGNLDYPSTWLVNLDSFNRNVTFSEDASGITSLTLFPGLMGQFTSAQDLAQQMTYLLQQQVPNLAIINQEYKILPTPGSGAIEITAGKVNLQGNYQGTLLRFDLEALVMYAGAYGSANGMGYAILTQAPNNIFVEKEQKYFNRMILSYKRALGIEK